MLHYYSLGADDAVDGGDAGDAGDAALKLDSRG